MSANAARPTPIRRSLTLVPTPIETLGIKRVLKAQDDSVEGIYACILALEANEAANTLDERGRLFTLQAYRLFAELQIDLQHFDRHSADRLATALNYLWLGEERQRGQRAKTDEQAEHTRVSLERQRSNSGWIEFIRSLVARRRVRVVGA